MANKLAMTNPIKILVGSPINERKAYIIDEWLDYVRSLTWHYKDILLVDNSHGTAFAKYVASKGFPVLHIEPKGRPEAFIAKSQNIIRERVLQGGYDYLFSLECDNFSATDIIERLLAHRKDNVNVPYFLNDVDDLRVGIQLPGFRSYDYRRFDTMRADYGFTYLNGKLRDDTAIPSLGCGLYSRRLLKKVAFRYDPNQPGKFSDSFFHFDSLEAGYTPYVDTSIFAEHKRNRQWHLQTT